MPDTDLLYAAIRVSAPTFAWVLAGLGLRRLGLLSHELTNKLSRWSFTFILPLLLFSGAARLDFDQIGDIHYLLAGALSTLLMVGLAWAYITRSDIPRGSKGIFVQAAYRSNLAIVGIALCASAYGEQGVILASLGIALWTTLFNILAVLVLNYSLGTSHSAVATLRGIATNPLIVGITAGVLLAISPLDTPVVVTKIGKVISVFFLPLILCCIGAAMSIGNLREAGKLAWQATFWRLVVAPICSVLVALLLGIRGDQLGVLFLLLASPVAASSFVMVVAARGDGTLAANMVMLSTLMSPITITTGFFLLRTFGLI